MNPSTDIKALIKGDLQIQVKAESEYSRIKDYLYVFFVLLFLFGYANTEAFN